jgi:protein-S-isoprenylcysteine O-methyltransferase Ste14
LQAGAIVGVMANPNAKAWLWLVVSFAVIGLVLFLSADTVDYWQGWVYLGVGVATSVPLTLLITGNPILRESRTRAGPTAEQRPIQRIIIAVTGLPMIAVYVVPGLDRRLGWSSVPVWLSIAGFVFIALSMWMVYRVFQENAYGSATVEVVRDQKVISTGPYAIVRNPMYSCAALYFVALSFALGSYWDLIPAVLIVLGLVWRLLDEEEMLTQGLTGYRDYCTKVRWHLIPGTFFDGF